MEELYAYALMLAVGFPVEEGYCSRLDALFAADPENELLLSLVWETQLKNAVAEIEKNADLRQFDWDCFGKCLMALLEKCYLRGGDFSRFAENAYEVWSYLPWPVGEREPFDILSYADDPLGYGDEQGARAFYEQAFAFYRQR